MTGRSSASERREQVELEFDRHLDRWALLAPLPPISAPVGELAAANRRYELLCRERMSLYRELLEVSELLATPAIYRWAFQEAAEAARQRAERIAIVARALEADAAAEALESAGGDR